MDTQKKALALLDARKKATQGEWLNRGDIYIFSENTMVADVNEDAAILRARGVGGGMSLEQQVANLNFCVLAANDIEEICKAYLLKYPSEG